MENINQTKHELKMGLIYINAGKNWLNLMNKYNDIQKADFEILKEKFDNLEEIILNLTFELIKE